MKIKPFLVKLMFVVILLLPLAGCTSDSNSPSGLTSASGNIWNGEMLYNQDGSEFGTVTGSDDNHQFSTGVNRGVEVNGTWYVRDFVINSKYVKK